MRRRAASAATIALAVSLALAAPASQAAARPHVSLALIERQAMCVTCKVALNESQSPQADLEREYIRGLIYQGDDEAEIKRSLVAQYGPTVLGLPSADGAVGTLDRRRWQLVPGRGSDREQAHDRQR